MDTIVYSWRNNFVNVFRIVIVLLVKCEIIQGVTFLLSFLIFEQLTIRQSKRLNLASTYVFAKFERFDWRELE